MKDSQFIELLNLYLDHEISPDKAALLEAEVTRDPARRQLYRQYCAMQKACVILAGQFAGDAPAEAAQAARVASARRSHAALWATGLVAAAACAAIALLPRLHSGAPVPVAAAAPASAALAQIAPAARPAAATSGDFHPVFVARSLADAAPASSAALFPATAPAAQFAWMQQVQLAPIGSLPATPLFLNSKPSLELDNRLDAERSPGTTPEERAAFQFWR